MVTAAAKGRPDILVCSRRCAIDKRRLLVEGIAEWRHGEGYLWYSIDAMVSRCRVYVSKQSKHQCYDPSWSSRDELYSTRSITANRDLGIRLTKLEREAASESEVTW